ncbi:MAG: DnaA regulatory inactivator Hda [Thiohalocapsa sp.]|nr:DnaA regulatory inactivator Hda [Thiohalocapsa sp.]
MDQLALALKLPEPCGFQSFVADGNGETRVAVERWAEGDGERYVYIHGAAGTGKTHLLQAACGRSAERGGAVAYLPLGAPGITPDILERLEQRDAVAVDAVEHIAADTVWEEALFAFYNRLQEAGTRLLVAGRTPPKSLGLRLADLASRLSAGAAYALLPLDDAGAAKLLTAAARQRGLKLDDAAIAYILSRCPREPASLLKLVEQIDRRSLQHRRAVTVRFIGELLSEREQREAGA